MKPAEEVTSWRLRDVMSRDTSRKSSQNKSRRRPPLFCLAGGAVSAYLRGSFHRQFTGRRNFIEKSSCGLEITNRIQKARRCYQNVYEILGIQAQKNSIVDFLHHYGLCALGEMSHSFSRPHYLFLVVKKGSFSKPPSQRKEKSISISICQPCCHEGSLTT